MWSFYMVRVREVERCGYGWGREEVLFCMLL